MSPRLRLVSLLLVLPIASCGGGGGGTTISPRLSPSTLSGSAPDATTVQLSWNDPNLRESGYAIERAGAAFQEIATVGANATAFTDTGLAPRKTYKYRIRALGSNGASDYSNVVMVVPPLPPEPTLLNIQPNEAFAGAVVWVRGSGFADFAPGVNTVLFGGVQSPSVTVLDDDRLMAQVPASASGAIDVDIANANGQAHLPGGVTAFAHPPVFPATQADLDTGPNAAGVPQVHCEGQNIYATWVAIPPGQNNDIYFSRSTDGGATWSAAVRLDTNDPPGASESVVPTVTSSGNNVYVAWRDSRTGEPRVFMNRSADGGLTWQGDAEVGTPPLGSREARLPQVVCEGDRVWVVYLDTREGTFNVFVSHSDDAGATWLPDQRIDVDNTGPAYVDNPRVVLSNNRLFVVWADQRGASDNVYSNRSLDGGATWLPQTVRVDRGTGGNAIVPRLAVVGDRVYVAWQDFRNGNADVFFNVSDDAGASFAAQDTPLENGVADASFANICADANRVFVAWTESGTVQLARSTNRGASFAGAVRVDTAAATADRVRVSCDGDVLFLAWILGDSEVWLQSSIDGGATLQPGGEVRVSPAGVTAVAEALCNDGPRSYLVYKTATDEIHANRNTVQ